MSSGGLDKSASNMRSALALRLRRTQRSALGKAGVRGGLDPPMTSQAQDTSAGHCTWGSAIRDHPDHQSRGRPCKRSADRLSAVTACWRCTVLHSSYRVRQVVMF